MSKPIHKVLVIRLSSLGDVAMCIPLIYSMCRKYPHIVFTMVTQKVASSLFINRPENLYVKPVETTGRHKGIRGIFELYSSLKGKRYDAAVDLHDVLRSKLLRTLLWLNGTQIVYIDKHRQDRKKLTRSKNKIVAPLLPVIDRYKEVFESIGLTGEITFTSLYGRGKGDTSLFADIIEEKNGRWIGIAPFAKHKGKIYPLEKMKQIVAHFAAQPDTEIFLFGAGEKEAAILHKWVIAYPHTHSLATRRHGFHKELALISHLDVMLSMDSANMHLASLVEVPVVSIWGATHPYAGFLGWKQHPENIVQATLDCRPCSIFGDKPCMRGDYACMELIEPRQVIEKLTNILGSCAPTSV